MSAARLPQILPLALVAVLSGCDRGAGNDPATPLPTAGDEEPRAREALLVRVAPIVVRDIARRLETTAGVESLDVVDVMPERSEPVASVLVEEGDVVTAGQLLASLRDEDARLAVAEAEVRVEETRVAMEQADRSHRRNLRLAESSGSGSTVLVSESDLEASQQALNASTTAAHGAEVALLRAELALAQCSLLAPIDGTIALRDISIGDMAAPGARAFQIVDLSRPKVVFYRPQREMPMLREGQELVATSEALPGADIHGRIERIAPIVDQATGTVKVVAALDASDTMLPTGILVSLVLELDRHVDALLVPKKALLREAGAVWCFAVRDGVARRVEILPGYEDSEFMEAVAGTDLAAGEVVVVVGADRLADGAPVELAAE